MAQPLVLPPNRTRRLMEQKRTGVWETGPTGRDVNGDGFDDVIVVAKHASDALNENVETGWILLGSRAGFTEGRMWPVNPVAVSIGDVNGDGCDELAARGSNHVSVFYGSGFE